MSAPWLSPKGETPQQMLRRTAELLRTRALDAEEHARGWSLARSDEDLSYREEVEAALGGPAGSLAYMFSPLTARMMARMFEAAATRIDAVPALARQYGMREAILLACTVLGEQGDETGEDT